MNNYKVLLIRLFTFLGGLYFVLKFLLPEKNQIINFKNIHEHVINGFTVIGSLAIGLGILNLIFVHGGKLVYKKSNWIFSAVLLLGLVIMLTVQALDWYGKEQNAQKTSRLLILGDFSKRIVEDSNAAVPGVLPRAEREKLLRAAFNVQLEEISKLDQLRDAVILTQETIAQSNFDEQALIVQLEKISKLDQQDNKELRDALILAQTTIDQSVFDDQIHKQFQERIAVVATLYREELDKRHSQELVSNIAIFLNQGLFVSLGSAMFSLLGFYIAAAAYRAFRVRSVEASLMMLAALIVMLGQIPFGLWISPHFPEIRMWLLQVPSAGAARAIEMGAGIAGLVLAIRMWLSLESDSFKS